MSTIVNILTTIGIFVGALLILVFVHELGHFLAAKFFGMRVDAFSVGFPPTIFRTQKGETEYRIGATPLGGYVKIAGMVDESMDTDQLEEESKPREFRSKPVWQRMIVISAGVIFNMILAIVIFAGIGLFHGQMEIPTKSTSGIYVPDSSFAHRVGFRTGDKLLKVNGTHPKYYSGFTSMRQMFDKTLSYTVLRNGKKVRLVMPDSLVAAIKHKPFISSQRLLLPAQIKAVIEGSPADTAGLKAGDKIVAINGQPVNSFQQMAERIAASKGTISLTILRNSHRFTQKVTPTKNNIIGIYSVVNPAKVFDVKHITYGPLEAIPFGFKQMKIRTVGYVQSIRKLFSGSLSIRKNLGGPVKIATITRKVTERGGWIGFWNITAMLSIVLAIMNILPIPALDGGHLVFLFYELVTRRKPSQKVKMALQQIGFFVIIAILILVTFNDILRLF